MSKLKQAAERLSLELGRDEISPVILGEYRRKQLQSAALEDLTHISPEEAYEEEHRRRTVIRSLSWMLP